MKKLISVFLLAVSLLLLSSCTADYEYDEAEVKTAAKDLIQRAEVYNDIFWGKGIPYSESNYSNGIYFAADDIYLKEMGFLKIEDIYLKAASVFSADYLDSIYTGMNTSASVRYYEEPSYIMVNSKYEPLLVDKVEYLYDTIEVLGYDGEILDIKIMIKVTRGEDTQTREKTIDLVKENGRWLLDSPTYANYRPTGAQK